MFCLYRCDQCGWEMSTWGPREFYRDASGARQPYGHPTALSAEAAARGIDGFDAQRYCVPCGRCCVVTVTEFVSPVHDPLTAWQGDHQAPQARQDLPPPVCPHCGTPNPLAALPEDEPTTCPACSRGTLRLAGGGVS